MQSSLLSQIVSYFPSTLTSYKFSCFHCYLIKFLVDKFARENIKLSSIEIKSGKKCEFMVANGNRCNPNVARQEQEP